MPCGNYFDSLFLSRITDSLCISSLLHVDRCVFANIKSEGAGGAILCSTLRLSIANSLFHSISAYSGGAFASLSSNDVLFSSSCVNNCTATYATAFSVLLSDETNAQIEGNSMINSLDDSVNSNSVFDISYGAHFLKYNNLSHQSFKERYIIKSNFFTTVEYCFNCISNMHIGRIFHFKHNATKAIEIVNSIVTNNTDNDTGINDLLYLENVALVVIDSVLMHNKLAGIGNLHKQSSVKFVSCCLFNNFFVNDTHTTQCHNTVIIPVSGSFYCQSNFLRTMFFSHTSYEQHFEVFSVIVNFLLCMF